MVSWMVPAETSSDRAVSGSAYFTKPYSFVDVLSAVRRVARMND